MIVTTLAKGDGVDVTEFDLEEEFSVELLSSDALYAAHMQYVSIENGHIVIRASNGTWWYVIVGFTFLNGHTAHTELVRYER